MLILYQDGETAIFLTEPSECVLQGDDKEILGTYDTPEEAKQIIQQFTKAYERGDLAFRVE